MALTKAQSQALKPGDEVAVKARSDMGNWEEIARIVSMDDQTIMLDKGRLFTIKGLPQAGTVHWARNQRLAVATEELRHHRDRKRLLTRIGYDITHNYENALNIPQLEVLVEAVEKIRAMQLAMIEPQDDYDTGDAN